jgi:translation initiation factor IF-2
VSIGLLINNKKYRGYEMAGIGLKQLTVSLVTKGILPEGTTEEELLDKLKSAEVLEKHDDVNSRVDTSKLQKLLIYLRGGEKREIVGKKSEGSLASSTKPVAGSKIMFRKKSTQSKAAVEIHLSEKGDPVKDSIDASQGDKVEVEQGQKAIEKSDIRENPISEESSISQSSRASEKAQHTLTPKPDSTVEKKNNISAKELLAESLKKQLAVPGHAARKSQKSNRLGYAEQKKLLKEERAVKKRGRKTKIQYTQSGSKSSAKRNIDPIFHDVHVPEMIKVSDLAKMMAVKVAAVIKILMNMGTMATINQIIDQDTALLVVEEMGHRGHVKNEVTVEDGLYDDMPADLEQVVRAPVVTIMGHVDHGKTSLLDYIRTTKVTTTEAGGITQHIGAYKVSTDGGDITFLDTPGHAAFTAMRARGAKCTDIVILVVAADDGVKPQTQEAIQHAKAAGVALIVAVNKMDKEGADPDNIRNQLSQHDVLSEEWGGTTMFQNISAKTGEGIDELLEIILLQAEMLELKAVADGPAKGVVIESRLDKGRGAVATVLVTQGVLKKGDMLLAGREYGRMRLMYSDDGTACTEVGPSTPVEVVGLSGAPSAGDDVMVVASERKAREVSTFRKGKFREIRLTKQHSLRLENIFDSVKEGKQSVLNIVLKADVQGSIEAIMESLVKLSTDEVKVNFISNGVGGIVESDVNLALVSGAIIIGFNVRADHGAKALVEKEEVDLKYYSIIYNLIDDVKSAMSGMLSPDVQEKITGVALVQEVFRSSKLGSIAGCKVEDGAMKRNLPIRVLRDNIVIYEGELESLRRFKDVVTEVKQGIECGIGVKNYNDIKSGDRIECYEKITVARFLA